MSTTTSTIRPGDTVTGRDANRLLLAGAIIRYADGGAFDLVKLDNDQHDAAWGNVGEDYGWGIDLGARWLVVSTGTS